MAKPTPASLAIALLASIAFLPDSQILAQTVPLSSCAASECRFNQTNGSTSSVGVGVSSSFGVSSSAQSTPNFSASSSSSLVLNSEFPNDVTGNASNSLRNSSIQTIGSATSSSPINIVITSDSVQSKSKDGSTSQTFNQDNQSSSADKFSDDSTISSDATFTAEGFSAIQDLRFKGGNADSSGSEYNTRVAPLIVKDADGNPVIGKEYGTGSSSASAETRTRFQADITTSTFVNAFMSSF